MKRSFLLTIVALLLFTAQHTLAQTPGLKLWYDHPAEKWTDALPIGNGTLGAMIFGGVQQEHIQFNEQTLWSGEPRQYPRNGAAAYLPVIRKLLFEGKQAEAEKLAGIHFLGKKSNEDTYPAQYAAWLKKVTANTSYANASFNDSAWPTMKLPTPNGWEATGLPGLDGSVWFRTTFELPKAWVGKDIVINLGKIRDMDITYINGKKVGSIDSTNALRKYTIKAADLKAGKNLLAIQIINPNDKGGFVGPKSDQQPYVIYPADANPKSAVSLGLNWKYFIQNDAPPAFPAYEASYLPFADLLINFKDQGKPENYYRDLNISDAVASTSYTVNGVKYTREYLASDPKKVIAIHLTASQPGHISFDALLQTEHKRFSVSRIDDHTLALNLKVNDGVLKGSSYLSVYATKGKVNVTAKGISISNADEVTLYLSAATSFVNYKNVSGQPNAICRQVMQAVKGKTYQAVKTAHVDDYHHYFNTFSINLGGSADEALPTDERIRRFEKTFDPSLLTLYTQYARYLMISCSRPDSKLPANLQGIWNDQIVPSWGSKFTTNINLEMNYWPVDELNLSPCAQPLINMVKGLSIAGRQTAKINYNLPGWILHHNTDIWLGTAPINASNHGIWVSGGAWLCHNMWEHYLFTRDEKFLREQAYPAMKACAEFFNSFLIKDPKTGYLISTPSNSPEHGGLVAGPAMDHQIIRDLFKNCIAAAKVLHTDAAFSKTLQAKYNRIAPNQIGKYGQLQEWMQDIDDTTDTHRHVSHLWGVYPGTDITWDNSPALMRAAEQSFKYRGDDGTGWSLAWKVNLMARFKHADHAMELVKKLLSVAENGSAKERGGVYHNLFDAHPPFQIDGNFGGAAGIAEMLLQSQQGYIDLLPALPAALPDGEVKGICARGAFVLNIKWTTGRLQQVTVTSKAGGKCQLKYADKQIEFNTAPGKTYTLNGSLKLL